LRHGRRPFAADYQLMASEYSTKTATATNISSN
jgi:hypothetical protein